MPTPETRERQCPGCHSEEIAPVGHVVTGDGLIRVEHRCEAGGIAFWFVRADPEAPSGKSRPRQVEATGHLLGTSHNIGALSAGTQYAMPIIAMADASPPLKETELRRCPQCRSADLLALGRVLADSTGIRSAYRCRQCATEFLLFFPDRRVGPRDRPGDELRGEWSYQDSPKREP